MTQIFTFEAIILGKDHPTWKNAAFVEFPYDTIEVFGIKGMVKVKAIFDDKASYRGLLSKMGHHCHILILTKDIRKAINKNHGDTVKVELMQDLEERTVEVPIELQTVLDQQAELATFFDSLSYSNRKEYARWIREAKRQATKESRLAKAIEKLKAGKKNPFQK